MTLQNFIGVDRERCSHKPHFEAFRWVTAKTTLSGSRIFHLLISSALIIAFTTSPKPAFAQYPAHPATNAAICASDLSARDKAISDDSFQGRGPGTVEGEAAADWIAEEMERVGLRPGNHRSYFQPVAAVGITLDPARSVFTVNTQQGALTPGYPDDTVYWSPQYAGDTVKVKASPLVFVGYGVVAPEYKWNDYADIDVKGKTVVILIHDPGNEDRQPDPDFFKGKAMTYYGRWTYKFEEAARQGAAAAEKGHFYRSDHFSLAKVGVPMLAPGGGRDLVEGGTAAGQAASDDYRDHRYHQPSDKWNPNWDLSGPIEDLDAYYISGRELADSSAWPDWYPGDEFQSTRDESMRSR